MFDFEAIQNYELRKLTCSLHWLFQSWLIQPWYQESLPSCHMATPATELSSLHSSCHTFCFISDIMCYCCSPRPLKSAAVLNIDFSQAFPFSVSSSHHRRLSVLLQLSTNLLLQMIWEMQGLPNMNLIAGAFLLQQSIRHKKTKTKQQLTDHTQDSRRIQNCKFLNQKVSAARDVIEKDTMITWELAG